MNEGWLKEMWNRDDLSDKELDELKVLLEKLDCPFQVSVHKKCSNSTDPFLKSTKDRDLIALLTKFLYAVRNCVGITRGIRTCRKEGFACEWIYPYGFVPEAGCPRHD